MASLAYGSCNGIGHINKVKLRRKARIVLALMTSLGGYAIPAFSRLLIPIQPGHPSVDKCSEKWQWFRPPLGKNGGFCVAVGPVTMTAGIQVYRMLAFNCI